MRYPDDWSFQEMHDKLSRYLEGVRTDKIVARTSATAAEEWAKRTHSRSLRACGVRMVSGFTPETRQRIEQLRAQGAIQ